MGKKGTNLAAAKSEHWKYTFFCIFPLCHYSVKVNLYSTSNYIINHLKSLKGMEYDELLEFYIKDVNAVNAEIEIFCYLF